MSTVFRRLDKPRYVDTPNGKRLFHGVVRYKKNILKIITCDVSIEVAEKHIFVLDGEEIFAKDLRIGDTLQTKEGYTKIQSIISLGEKEVFDLASVDGEIYYTNNILSHNTFVGSSYTLISADKLKDMMPKEPEIILDNKLNVYKVPIKGHQYIMAVDPSKDGKDSFAVQVLDITNFEFKQVASAKLDIEYLAMPAFLDEWCEYFHYPYLIIENNEGAGQSVADQMYQTYEYENLHFDNSGVKNRKKKYPGTRTTPKSRKQILQTLKTFVENNMLEIIDKDTINELFSFILVNNKYQADSGCHDDMVMSLALAFTIFNDTKNFNDMKEVTDVLFNDSIEKKDVDISEIITVGDFDDGTAENYEYSNSKDVSYEEYLVDLQDTIDMRFN